MKRKLFLISLTLHLLAAALIASVVFYHASTPVDVSFNSESKNVMGRTTLPQSVRSQSSTSELKQVSEESASGVSEHKADHEIDYRNALRTQIMQHLYYPSSAQKHHLEGVVEVEIELSERGELISCRPIFDENKPKIASILVDAALKSVRDAAPFLVPPAANSHRFQIPIDFHF